MTNEVGVQSVTLTAGETVQQKAISPYTVNVLLRADSDNAGTVYVAFGKYTAGTGDITLSAGESISINISEDLKLKMAMGYALCPEDFLPDISYKGSAADQTLYVDIFTLSIPKDKMVCW